MDFNGFYFWTKMAVKRIKDFFREWEAQSMLDDDGALVIDNGGSAFRNLSVFLILGAVGICCWFDMMSYLVPFIVAGVILALLITPLFRRKQIKFYSDGFVYGGRMGKRYSYDDILTVRKYSVINSDEDSIFRQVGQQIVVGFDGKTFCIDGKYAYFRQINSFFYDFFEPRYFNYVYYDSLMYFFAALISSKENEDYRQIGIDYVWSYMEKSQYREYPYKQDLKEYMDRFGASDNWSAAHKKKLDDIAFISERDGMDYRELLKAMEVLIGCAYASDRVVDQDEIECLTSIADSIGVMEWDFNRLLLDFTKKKKKQAEEKDYANQTEWDESFERVHSSLHSQACAQLAVDENASLDDIKSVYRSKVKACHPDVLSSNASDKEREEAAVKFRTLTEAYDFLCEELTLKSE